MITLYSTYIRSHFLSVRWKVTEALPHAGGRCYIAKDNIVLRKRKPTDIIFSGCFNKCGNVLLRLGVPPLLWTMWNNKIIHSYDERKHLQKLQYLVNQHFDTYFGLLNYLQKYKKNTVIEMSIRKIVLVTANSNCFKTIQFINVNVYTINVYMYCINVILKWKWPGTGAIAAN